MPRGSKSKTTDKFWIVDRLNEIKEDKQRMVSYHLLMKLEEKGLITPVERRVTPGRGKPRKFYELSSKGKGYLNLSVRWKRPGDEVKTVKSKDEAVHA